MAARGRDPDPGPVRIGSGSGSGSGSSGGSNLDATLGDDDGGDDGPVSDPSCAANDVHLASYVNLAPPMLSALDRGHSDALITDAGVTTPAGWNFYKIDSAICRDGSPNGIFVRYSNDPVNSNKLMIYLEGGGACFSPHFCDHNPANLDQMFSGGADVQGEGFNALLADNLVSPPVPQLPWDKGIFDFSNPANPFKGWNQVYIPYCTATCTSARTTTAAWRRRSSRAATSSGTTT